MKRLKFMAIMLAMSLLPASCGGNVDINIGNESEEPEEKEDAAPPSGEPEKEEMKFDYRFASLRMTWITVCRKRARRLRK